MFVFWILFHGLLCYYNTSKNSFWKEIKIEILLDLSFIIPLRFEDLHWFCRLCACGGCFPFIKRPHDSLLLLGPCLRVDSSTNGPKLIASSSNQPLIAPELLHKSRVRWKYGRYSSRRPKRFEIFPCEFQMMRRLKSKGWVCNVAVN